MASITKEDIKSINITGYMDFLTGLPQAIEEYIKQKNKEKDDISSVYNEYKEMKDGHYKKLQWLKEHLQNVEKDNEELEKNIILLYCVYCHNEKIDITKEYHKTDYASKGVKVLNVLNGNIKSSKLFFKTSYEVNQEDFEKKSMFNNNAIENKIKDFENNDYPVLNSLNNNIPDIRIMSFKGAFDVFTELGDLEFFKSIAANKNIDDKTITKRTSEEIHEALKTLKEIGCFDCGKFKDLCSARQQSEILSKIIGVKSNTLRRRYYKSSEGIFE